MGGDCVDKGAAADPSQIGGLTVAHRWRNFDRIATSAITYAVAAMVATGVYDWSS
jgi:hypothetical protein